MTGRISLYIKYVIPSVKYCVCDYTDTNPTEAYYSLVLYAT